jgi:Holliday junction resolvasome RuvABC endonuclease subunit
MITIGIDQSISSSGVVVMDDGVMIHHELVRLPPVKGFREKVVKMQSIADALVSIAREYKADEVYIEELAYAATGDAAKDLAGLFAIILRTFLFDLPEVSVNLVNPKWLKKIATKNGNAKKEMMFDALPEHIQGIFGEYPKTKGRFDLTDAYFIAYYGPAKKE